MSHPVAARRRLAAVAVALLAVLSARAFANGAADVPATVPPSRVDALFSRWTRETPGCAVGVSREGRVLVERAYGLADLERDVPNTPRTVFEAGSVSKQVTAAAVLLLARDGKLSLDDPVRKYLPELPDYGTPLTIRHMLTHTSGLRDWGSVAAIGGWPRTTRVYTHAHVVDIAARQRALNFTPGTNWSYSNTGYNLAVVIVSRVAGMPFAEFCRRRLFEPLHMDHTSWRDDHTRIVKGRALAYAGSGDTYHTLMPFENVHGNGGLLTTVGDLLRWNDRFDEPKDEDVALVRLQQERATLDNGRTLGYALGLYVQRYRGLVEIGHSGSTAGYRAHLVRYPERRLSVAVLCNASSATPEVDARAVAGLYLGARAAAPRPSPAPLPQVAPLLDARAGLYRHLVTGKPLRLLREKDALRLEGGPPLVAASATRFELPPDTGGAVLEFEGEAGLVVTSPEGLPDRYERVTPAEPTPADLSAFIGRYVSDEADTAFDVSVEKAALMLLRWPNFAVPLRPLYADAFSSPIGTIRFHRDGGRVVGLSVVNDRVWDLRFSRQ